MCDLFCAIPGELKVTNYAEVDCDDDGEEAIIGVHMCNNNMVNVPSVEGKGSSSDSNMDEDPTDADTVNASHLLPNAVKKDIPVMSSTNHK